jgi:hypothetical protein
MHRALPNACRTGAHYNRNMISMLRRFVCLSLLAAIAAGPLTACSGATKTAAVAGLDDSINSLAAAGVGVVDNVTSQMPIAAVTGTPSAMRFTRWQVQNLVAEANAHSGYLASELDALATPPPGAPQLSGLISAWLTQTNDPLAQYAARFMTGQDDKKTGIIVFPTLVVLSFIADIARVPARTSHVNLPSFDLERLIAEPADAQDGKCTDVSNFVSTVVTSVTNAIEANGPSWLATFWGIVSATASTVVKTVTGILTPLVAFITKIATICATIMQVSSMFKPWTVSLAGSAPSITLTQTPQSGSFDATLHAQDIPWPSELVSCVAELSGVKLDDASYKDAPVVWSQPINIPGLATNVSADKMLLADKTAHYAFSTSTVAAVGPDDCPRDVPSGKLGVTVTVERSDVTKTLNSLESIVTSQIPIAALRSYLQPYIDTANTAATTAASTFAAPHQSSVIAVNEQVADPLCIHTPPPGSPAPSDTPTQTAANGTLPYLPCAQMLEPADIEPYMSGAFFVTGTGAQQFADGMSGMFQIGSQGAGANTYDTARTTTCLLGIGTMTAPTEADPNPPVTAKIAGIFMTTPAGSLGGDSAVPPGTPNQKCTSVIGADTLARLKAVCVDFGPALDMVTVMAPNVQIAIVGMPKSGAGDNGLPLGPDAALKVMAHLLKRYAP